MTPTVGTEDTGTEDTVGIDNKLGPEDEVTGAP